MLGLGRCQNVLHHLSEKPLSREDANSSSGSMNTPRLPCDVSGARAQLLEQEGEAGCESSLETGPWLSLPL